MSTVRPDPGAARPELVEEARDLLDAAVQLRRDLHQWPEVGNQLPITQQAVLAALEGLPLDVTVHETTSGITGLLTGRRPGPTIVLRGDMDALPMHEDTGLPFSSEVYGAMHSCGHDLHTAMLVGAAKLLQQRRDQLPGDVVLMFQPGEESSHGARMMIDEGLLSADGPGGTPESAMALHVTSRLAAGTLQTRPDSIMASSDDLHVTVTGRGGHASAPHDALDPVPAAAAMVGALQTMVTRRFSVFDPAVLTVGRITAGTTSNIIPETAELQGTVRTLSDRSRALVQSEIPKVCEHIAAAHGCTTRFRIDTGYPSTNNDATVAPRVLELAGALLGQKNSSLMAEPLMASEDFSYVLQQVPGALAFLGACPPGVTPDEAAPNHSNRVHFDESAFAHGVALYAAFALDALR
jgi:amidohydrolase